MMLGVAPVPVPASHASKLMKAELEAVSTILGCEYIFDKQATKEKFLEEASKATVLHIVSQANLDEGYIVMSCNNDKLMGEESISEKYYLVTVEDISKVNMKAKLVVISGGWAIRNLRAEQGSLHTLPSIYSSR
ncbi:hypothetical protein EB796_007866 [Bugula neritina]|uniref:Uncharacterized protein n=1 Tax=Bugula neritina TaxID=10212 RepID=A0A7J7K5B3_BUGNE|nr:hypothetical protein EB796_007866 [Bugula neritina]